jgi:hypothetical protein
MFEKTEVDSWKNTDGSSAGKRRSAMFFLATELFIYV